MDMTKKELGLMSDADSRGRIFWANLTPIPDGGAISARDEMRVDDDDDCDLICSCLGAFMPVCP